jgi:hypothetical protein
VELSLEGKMEKTVKIGRYDDSGLHLEWYHGFEISVTESQGEVVIRANEAGLISLAQHLLTLAEHAVPAGSHIHMDASRELEDESLDLVLERTA